MPTLNKIASYQFLHILLEGINHEQSSQNYQSRWCLTLKYRGGFFPKEKLFMGGRNFLDKFVRGIHLKRGV